jgi:hypothetical protein
MHQPAGRQAAQDSFYDSHYARRTYNLRVPAGSVPKEASSHRSFEIDELRKQGVSAYH